MPVQTGGQERSPVFGKMKNCASWGEFEAPNTSPTANFCNGGWYDGDYYDPCPARMECRNETLQRLEQPRRVIATTPDRPLGSRIVVNSGDHRGLAQWQPSAPRTIPMAQHVAQHVAQQQMSSYGPTPTPVIPPQDFPTVMTTPYAAPIAFHAGGISPTFLPQTEESVLGRLAKNIIQGALSALGWQVFDMSRNVDMFKRRQP